MSHAIEATLESTPSSITEIAELTRAGVVPQPLELGQFYVVHGADGSVNKFDLTGDQYRDKTGQVTASVAITHADSLLSYWDKHSDTESDMFADRERRTITAIIDAHAGSGQDQDDRPGWQTHRATLTLALSEPMAAWLNLNGKIMEQVAFAEFCEDWMSVIAAPDAADLIEMVTDFQATVSASFKSGFKLSNGQRVMEYTEQIDQAVKGGKVAVPQTIVLSLPIWRGAADRHELTARIRTRVNHGGAGKLGIGYKLDRPTDVIDAAFEAEVARVQEHIGRPVLRGTPAGA